MPDHATHTHPQRALRLGVAGPVGTGKSSLIATVCRALATERRLVTYETTARLYGLQAPTA